MPPFVTPVLATEVALAKAGLRCPPPGALFGGADTTAAFDRHSLDYLLSDYDDLGRPLRLVSIRSLTRVSRSRVRDSFLFFGFSGPCFLLRLRMFFIPCDRSPDFCVGFWETWIAIFCWGISTEGSGIVGSSRRGLWKTVLAAYRFLSHATITSVFLLDVENIRYHFAFH